MGTYAWGRRRSPDRGSSHPPNLNDLIGPPSLRASVFPTLRAGAGPGHVEYPTALAYAAGLLAMHCVEEAASLEDTALRTTARRLRCTTFFGAFGLDADGRQTEHEMLVVQWQEGIKAVVWPLEQPRPRPSSDPTPTSSGPDMRHRYAHPVEDLWDPKGERLRA